MAFGFFHTESSHHASEYVPYFRKNPRLTQRYIAERWDYLEICRAHDATDRNQQLLEDLEVEK